jgi:hypothetical protein
LLALFGNTQDLKDADFTMLTRKHFPESVAIRLHSWD